MNDSDLKALTKRLERFEIAVRQLAHETSLLAAQIAFGRQTSEITETSDRLKALAHKLTSGLGGAD